MDLCVDLRADVGVFFQWWKITLDQITGQFDQPKGAFTV